MPQGRRVRFIEPGGKPGRPFNAWIRRWPLLGPITLATILDRKGYDARVYNENISGPLLDNPLAYADVCSADVVAISIMTATAPRGYALAQHIRRDAPETTIAFGGVHATFLPEEARHHGDVVCCGEGETVIEAIADGSLRSGIVRAEPLADLDELPPLKHELTFDFERLVREFGRRDRYELNVMTSRGCPHACTFCSVSRMFGRKVRRQSVQKVLADLRVHRRRGFRRLFFADDNFTSNRDWSRRLMEGMRPLQMTWNAQARADFPWIDGRRRRLDRPLLQAMRRAGGALLYIGYETVDDETAAHWNKGYRGSGGLRDRLLEDTAILHNNNFWIHGMFVLGPEHTQRHADQIVSFARDAGVESMQISILTPLPGTPLYDEMRPHLTFADYPDDWTYYDGTHCVYNHCRLGAEGLQKAVFNAHERFYRWGGISVRRTRALLEERLGAWHKLANLWRNARTARTMMREWRSEMRQFLRVLRARMAATARAAGG